jgi:hydroxymethylbilane synthase
MGSRLRTQIRIGTRGSLLAMAQAREVRDRLAASHEQYREPGAVEIVAFKTTGDVIQDRTLTEVGGKGLFTKEIEEALASGQVDLAVHSMKDMPTWLPSGLEIACVLPREDPRDAFISGAAQTLDDLPAGSVIGTASLRRQALVLARRRDVTVVPLRGNVQTRLRKLAEGQVEATILAVAGLRRLGALNEAASILEPDVMLPAVAQGAIGVEIRSDDGNMRMLLEAIHCRASGLEIETERAFLAVLDGSCRTPIAGLARISGDCIEFHGLAAKPDGTSVLRVSRSGLARDAARLGTEAGQEIKAVLPPTYFIT